MTRPTFLGLFEGIGGLSLALEHHGWRCVGQVENDPYCAALLAERWPQVPRWGDIQEVDWTDVIARIGTPDLVAAGFPCQPTSQAGRRKAQADPRWLWPEVARCLRHLRPRFAFLENTLGLLSRGFDDVLGDLATLGFDAEWDCFQAADMGAPHQRDRVFVLALQRRGEPGDLAGPPGPGASEGPQRQRHGHATRDRGTAVGDPEVQRRGRPWLGEGRPGSAPEPRRSGALGTQPGLGGDAPGLPAGLDGHRWPAPPGPNQHPWEPPRTVGKGVPHRGRRVKALGNAVVPQQGALAFAVLWQRMREVAA